MTEGITVFLVPYLYLKWDKMMIEILYGKSLVTEWQLTEQLLNLS